MNIPQSPSISVVIPAHNEARVIARLLRALTEDPRSSELEIVVVANGCTDDTAACAAAVDPSIVVRELSVGSKIAALRVGDQIAQSFPRAYVDADVTVSVAALLSMAEALSKPGGPLVASPKLIVDASGADWLVRSFFRIWELTEYRQSGLIGAGIYALSAEGRARFGDWPQVVADDRFIQQLFLDHERLVLDDHTFTVRSPRTIGAHLRREIRIARGNVELPSAIQRARRRGVSRHAVLLGRVLRRPKRWLDLVGYFLITFVVRLLARQEAARGSSISWNRDESTRTSYVG